MLLGDPNTSCSGDTAAHPPTPRALLQGEGWECSQEHSRGVSQRAEACSRAGRQRTSGGRSNSPSRTQNPGKQHRSCPA
jgi:hypothetical protein